MRVSKRRLRTALGIIGLGILIPASVVVLVWDATQRLAGNKPYWTLNWSWQPVDPAIEIVGAIVIACIPVLWLINRKRLDKESGR